MLRVEHIFVSAGHDFFGRHGQPRDRHSIVEVEEVECVAGQGLRGDRFFGHRPDYKGQVTFFAAEVFAELCIALDLAGMSAAALRRNVLVRGQNLNALIGTRFELQGLQFEGVEECRPCHWMDQALKPGAEAWLKHRGGLRCRILSTGWLRRTPRESIEAPRANLPVVSPRTTESIFT